MSNEYPPTIYLTEEGDHQVTIKAATMKYGDEAKPPWADTSLLVVAETDDGRTAFVNLEVSPLKFKSGDRPEWLVARLNENLNALGINAKYDKEDYDPQAAIVDLNEKHEAAKGQRVLLNVKTNDRGYQDYKFKANLGPAKQTNTEPVPVEEVAEAFEAEVF